MEMEKGNFVVLVMIIIGFVLGAYYLVSKNDYRWSIYKKRYLFISVTIIILCALVIFTTSTGLTSENSIVSIICSLITGFLASIIYGIFNLESDPKFAEKVAQEAAGLLDGAMPYKVYPESKSSERPFKEDLIESLKQTKEFHYFGIRMTVTVDCLLEVFSKKTQDIALDTLLFNIPIIENELLRVEDLESMKKSLIKLKDLFVDDKNKYKHNHEVNLIISLLNFYPPFHIHQTDSRSWFAAVKLDKETIPYPPTYLYEKTESTKRNSDSSSMFDTIKRMVELTSKNATEYYRKTIPFGNDAERRKAALFEKDKEDIFSVLVSRIDEQINKKKESG